MKFLHCADIHVDSPLRGLSPGEGVPAEEIRLATRRAVDNLVDLAVDEAVTAVVVAGDLYDGDRDDYDTAIYLQRKFARLREAGIPVVLAYGNHDAASEITRRLRPPDNVHVLAHKAPETLTFADSGLAFHGQSYGKRAETDDLSAGYPPRVPNLLNVGVLHTCLDGRPGHDPYAPCRLGSLVNHGYEYWALGHVHMREVTRREGVWVVFPGNLQGRHARETGAKGATLVEYDGDRIVGAEHCDLDTVRWLQCSVDVSDAPGVDDVLAAVIAGVEAAVDDSAGRLTAVRVLLNGTSSTATRLSLDREAWEAQLRADLAGASGRVWLEKVVLSVQPPPVAEGPVDRGEAIAAVLNAITDLREDASARGELAGTFSALRTKLGGDLQRLSELGCPDLSEAGVGELLDDVELLLLARLEGRD